MCRRDLRQLKLSDQAARSTGRSQAARYQRTDDLQRVRALQRFLGNQHQTPDAAHQRGYQLVLRLFLGYIKLGRVDAILGYAQLGSSRGDGSIRDIGSITAPTTRCCSNCHWLVIELARSRGISSPLHNRLFCVSIVSSVCAIKAPAPVRAEDVLDARHVHHCCR